MGPTHSDASHFQGTMISFSTFSVFLKMPLLHRLVPRPSLPFLLISQPTLKTFSTQRLNLTTTCVPLHPSFSFIRGSSKIPPIPPLLPRANLPGLPRLSPLRHEAFSFSLNYYHSFPLPQLIKCKLFVLVVRTKQSIAPLVEVTRYFHSSPPRLRFFPLGCAFAPGPQWEVGFC
jgi:hypothetical protein